MWIIAVIVGLGALWDGFTAFFGIAQIFGILNDGPINPLQVIFAAVVSMVILGFLVATHIIWSYEGDDLVSLILKGAWVVCLVLNCYTAYIGNKHFVFGSDGLNGSHQFGLVIITLLITLSAILLSRIMMMREMRRRGYLY
jgi:hypothetical protein